jgi:phosphatidylglycerol:prolipoprotein diacylglycerol transferase
VHPTQLYEAAALAVIAWLLVGWRRNTVGDVAILGRYFILAGSTRFVIEFIRVNLPVLGPLTLAQLISLSLIIAGTVLLVRRGTVRDS